MAIEFQNYLEKKLGSRPHLIVSRLSRFKMDPNRPIAQAANHNPLAEKVIETSLTKKNMNSVLNHP